MPVKFLVDTNILSAGAPRRGESEPFVTWMDRVSARLYLSVVTIAEIEAGIRKVARAGAHKRAEELGFWLAAIEHLYTDRILPLEITGAKILGQISDAAAARGLNPGFPDLAIAATAQAHGCTILTRNAKHFAPLDVPVLNPYEDKLPEF